MWFTVAPVRAVCKRKARMASNRTRQFATQATSRAAVSHPPGVRMFRHRYLNHAEILDQLGTWASRYPDIAHLGAIGKRAAGRDIALLTIGRDPDQARPAV